MEAITIPVIVDENRRVVLKLPDSTPIGLADLEIVVHPKADTANGAKEPRTRGPNPATEAARIKLAAAGILSTDIHAPIGMAPPSDEEIERLGQLPAGARLSEELIDEDRGPH